MAHIFRKLVIISVLVVYFTCVLKAAVIVSKDETSSMEDVTEGVEISYDALNFKEIDHDILQVIQNPSKISLTCHSRRNNASDIAWRYHGSDLYTENEVNFNDISNNHEVTIDLSDGPPVARMECVLKSNTSIKNNTLIYTGDDEAPYLFNNQRTVKASVVNESIAVLPCLLKYPLDNKDDKQLLLYKSGELVENKHLNNCLNYTPEHGFFLNLTKLEHPLGLYECKVENSTKEDYVMVELTTGSFIHVKYKGEYSIFHEKSPILQEFSCTVPKSMFNQEFKWFYLRKNGTYEPFEPQRMRTKNAAEQALPIYVDSVLITFDSTDITHVVCSSSTIEDSKYFNSTLSVEVIESFPPEIVNDPNQKPVIYEKGKNITCGAIGEPIKFRWKKDGNTVSGLRISTKQTGDVKTSTLVLEPKASEKKSNYTCEASNFLGNATFDFLVQLQEPQVPKDDPEWTTIIVVSIFLAIMAIGLVVVFKFYDVKFTRRFSAEKIELFFGGHTRQLPGSDVPFQRLNDYHSVPFDKSKDIKHSDVVIDRLLKEGNFGKVHLGYYKKGNVRLPVGVKMIKDNPNASEEDMEYNFEKFLSEIKLMQSVGKHANVVGYIGAVTSDLAQYSAYLLVEYCSEGDLKTYLKEHRESFHDDLRNRFLSSNPNALTTSILMKWAEEIAAGMHYLFSKRFLHRDLAARNIFLHNTGFSLEGQQPHPELLVAKIGDFGLSKDLDDQPKDYYQIVFHPEKSNRKVELPLPWYSPETLKTLKFTPENDQWALGVLYWEIFTLGNTPYSEIMPEDPQHVRQVLISYLENDRLSEPDYGPDIMWEVMQCCFDEDPAERPSFENIAKTLHLFNQANKQREFSSNTGYSQVDFLPKGSFDSGVAGEEMFEEIEGSEKEE